MSTRIAALLGALLVVTVIAPVAAQDPSASPASSPAASPAASLAPAITGGPSRGRPQWAKVRDRDVRRSGMLDHAVTLGAEVIALAPVTTRDGQARMRVLATVDGSRWTKRGRIPLTGDVADLLADGTSLYAVGWDERATIWRSTDAGRTWTTPVDGAPFDGDADGLPALAEGAQVLAITRGPAGLLAVGDAVDPDTLGRRAAAWRSADGLAWERLPGAGALPPFQAIAGNSATYVVVGSSIGAATSPPGADAPVLRWSVDGAAWTDAVAEIGPMEAIVGVSAVPDGFLAWGNHLDAPGARAIIWSSADGRTWERDEDDPALAAAHHVALRSLEGGALVMAVGGAPEGAYGFAWQGSAWRKDPIRRRDTVCVRDVASVRAILVAVGGTCGGPRQQGRAWTTPLEP